MRDYIGANDIANQVSMLRSTHKGPVLVVEGVTDKRLYGKLSDSDECEIIIGHSKDNVRIAVRELFYKRNDKKVFGIMDADMDRLTGSEPSPPLFITDVRDSEMMMISSPAFDSVLWEYGEEDKLEAFAESHGEIKEAVLNASFPIGLLMYVSSVNDFGLSFKDLDYSRFIDPKDLSINIRNLVDEVLYHSKNPSGNAKHIRNKLVKEMDEGHDRWDVCRGHDAVGVMLIGLKKIFGSYNSRNIRCGELGGALRLAFGLEDFMDTELYKRTSRWCSEHGMKVWLIEGQSPL